jgi:hypothetical protein
VIGIPTLAAEDPEMGGAADGIGFAISSNIVRSIAAADRHERRSISSVAASSCARPTASSSPRCPEARAAPASAETDRSIAADALGRRRRQRSRTSAGRSRDQLRGAKREVTLAR